MISMLSVRLGITILVFVSLILISSIFFAILNKFKKQAVHSFIKAWNSLLQLLGFLIILALVIITIIVYCTQVPWNNLGLLFELLTSLTLLASSTVVAILSKRTNRNILEMPPKTEEEKYEEKEVLNAEP